MAARCRSTNTGNVSKLACNCSVLNTNDRKFRSQRDVQCTAACSNLTKTSKNIHVSRTAQMSAKKNILVKVLKTVSQRIFCETLIYNHSLLVDATSILVLVDISCMHSKVVFNTDSTKKFIQCLFNSYSPKAK